MKKKITAREWFLLLLPVVALGGYAYWAHISKPAVRYALVVQRVDVESATPIAVYDGFDTLVNVKYPAQHTPEMFGVKSTAGGMSGFRDVRLEYKTSKGTYAPVPLPLDSYYEGRYLSPGRAEAGLRLSKVPVKYGELVFKASIGVVNYYNVTEPDGTLRSKMVEPTRSPIFIVVRKAGEVVVAPEVSKVQPYSVKFVFPDPVFKYGPGTSIRVVLKIDENQKLRAEEQRWRYFNLRIVDSKGRVYLHDQHTLKKFKIRVLDTAQNDEDWTTYESVLNISTNLLPKDAGKVTFKAEVSLNDGWPMSLSYTIPN